MFLEFIVPLVIVLVFCYLLMPKFKYGVDRQIIKTNVLLNKHQEKQSSQKNKYRETQFSGKQTSLKTISRSHHQRQTSGKTDIGKTNMNTWIATPVLLLREFMNSMVCIPRSIGHLPNRLEVEN